MLLRYTVVSTCSYRHYRSIGQGNKQTHQKQQFVCIFAFPIFVVSWGELP